MKLRVLHAPDGLEDLGPWEVRPDPVAFSAAAAEPPPLVFRFDLPGGAGNAERALDLTSTWLARTREHLETVPGRIEDALRRAHGPVSYATTSMAPADAWLTSQLATEAVDYSIGDKVKRALRGLLDVATRLAWVETIVKDQETLEDRFVARSRIGLSGDLDMVVRTVHSAKNLDIHCRAVAAARETKDAWLRILTMVTNVARQLAKFATNPAAAVAALPTAWAYIKRIVAEVKALM